MIFTFWYNHYHQRLPSLLKPPPPSPLPLLPLWVVKSCHFPSLSSSKAILSFSPLALPFGTVQLPNKQPDSSIILPYRAHAPTHTHTPIISSVLHPIAMKVTEQASWQTTALGMTAATASGQRWIWMDRAACHWLMGTNREGLRMGWKTAYIRCYMDTQQSISQQASYNLSDVFCSQCICLIHQEESDLRTVKLMLMGRNCSLKVWGA